MLVKDYQKFLNLAKVLNTTFGTEGEGNRQFNTQSVKFDLLDDGLMKVRYLMIVNFGSDTMMREMMKRYRVEAMSMLEGALKTVKEEYKKKFPDSDVPDFEIKEATIGDDIEWLSYNMYAGKRKAYYRFGCLVEIK